MKQSERIESMEKEIKMLRKHVNRQFDRLDYLGKVFVIFDHYMPVILDSIKEDIPICKTAEIKSLNEHPDIEVHYNELKYANQDLLRLFCSIEKIATNFKEMIPCVEEIYNLLKLYKEDHA